MYPILFLWNAFFGIYLSVIFTFINIFFTGILSKFGPSAFNSAWPVLMLFYNLYTYYHGNWRYTLVYFAGIPYIILGFLLILFRSENYRSSPTYSIENASSDSSNKVDSNSTIEQNESNRFEVKEITQTERIIK